MGRESPFLPRGWVNAGFSCFGSSVRRPCGGQATAAAPRAPLQAPSVGASRKPQAPRPCQQQPPRGEEAPAYAAQRRGAEPVRQPALRVGSPRGAAQRKRSEMASEQDVTVLGRWILDTGGGRRRRQWSRTSLCCCCSVEDRGTVADGRNLFDKMLTACLASGMA